MSNHTYRGVLLTALAALALGVAALGGAPQALAAAPAFTVVNENGNAIPDYRDIEGIHYDVATIVGAGSDMVVVDIDATTTWNLTGSNAGTVAIAGYSSITFSGIGYLVGGDGDDTFGFAGGAVTGTINGGAGVNTLDYSSRTNNVTVILSTGSGTGTGGISSIQNAIGGHGNDTLTGDASNNVLTGGPSTDNITGGGGVDTLVETRDANFTLANTILTIGAEGNDTLRGIQAARLTGGPGNNTLDASTFTGQADLDGGPGNDVLRGGASADVLIGGAGDDAMYGGAGTDTVAETRDADFALTDTSLTIGAEGEEILSSIEAAQLTGGSGNNSLTASSFTGAVVLDGGAGNDTLRGGTGADELIGGAGDDAMSGGAGNDAMSGGAGIDTVVETRDANFTLENGHLTIGAEGTDTLSGIEAAHLTGGPGSNTLDASSFSFPAVLDGGAGNDTLRGGSGSDRLIGGADNDVMIGGPGNDQYSGGPGTNTITEPSTGGDADTIVETCDSDFTLTDSGLAWIEGRDQAGVGTFLGNIEGVRLIGGHGDNRFDISALAGGTIFVDGGEGFDTLAVDPHGATANVITDGIAVPFFSQSTTYVSIEAVIVVAPILHLPDDVTVEATSADGAVVEFTATAEDANGSPLTATCDPASGSTFPVGANTVNCSATDGSGNTTTGSFTVTIVDAAPVLHLPDDMTVEAAGAAGAVVEFTATANDAVDGAVAVSCDPASGSTFPVGATPVNCTATDSAGNKATGSFTVTVTPFVAQISWSGFLQPINGDDSSVFKLKSTVPVRFALTGDSAGITDLVAKFCYAKVSSGVVGDVVEAVSTSAATSGDLFRYDPTSGQYIFNWGTKGLTKGTYQLRVDLGDGVEHVVRVSLK